MKINLMDMELTIGLMDEYMKENGLMIINKSGIAIRMAVEDLRVMGRATQGVKLINIKDGDSIAAVAKVIHEKDEDQHDEELESTEENNTNSEQ